MCIALVQHYQELGALLLLLLCDHAMNLHGNKDVSLPTWVAVIFVGVF